MGNLLTTDQYKKALIGLIETYIQKGQNELYDLVGILKDEANVKGDYPTNPGEPSLDSIESTGEKAFQRACINSKFSYLKYRNDSNPEMVLWLDLELPVTLNKNSRRRSIDLIGKQEDAPVLCELKYREKSRSDHPVYAVFELLTYYYLIQCNHEKLDLYKVHHDLPLPHVPWKSFVQIFSTQLLVVANKSYWEYWLKLIDKIELIGLVMKCIKDLDVNLHLFSAPDEDFVGQKATNNKYKPMITSTENWEKIEI